MNYYDIIAKWLINMFIFTNGPHIGLMDRFNAGNDTVKHFWKCTQVWRRRIDIILGNTYEKYEISILSQ